MSDQVRSRLLLQLLLFFSATTVHKTSSIVVPGDLNCLEFDVETLENYLNQLDLQNLPSTGVMIGGFKCPVTALPFGALKSDWARLMLLRDAQPKESILREKLDRLFRILVLAYYQMEEHFDVTLPDDETLLNTTVESWSKNNTATTFTENFEVLTENPYKPELNEFEYTTVGYVTGNRFTSGTESRNLTEIPTTREEGETSSLPESLATTSKITASYSGTVNKTSKPQIRRKPPRRNEFWKLLPVPQKLTAPSLTSIGPVFPQGQKVTAIPEDWPTSGKNGSINTDTGKIFRWFYSLNRENSPTAGVKIGCETKEKNSSCCN